MAAFNELISLPISPKLLQFQLILRLVLIDLVSADDIPRHVLRKFFLHTQQVTMRCSSTDFEQQQQVIFGILGNTAQRVNVANYRFMKRVR